MQHTPGILNVPNRTLYHGDNLDFMRALNSNSVHLIATDPPFNKGRDFHATPDSLAAGAKFQDRWSWDKDVHPAWKEQIEDDWPALWFVIEAAEVAYGQDMGAFLCWLAVRVIEMHRVLREDGSLYLHCDHTAGAYIKAMLDAVFGKKNFRNEITWKRTARGFKGSQFKPRNYNVNTDCILFYGKTSHAFFNMDEVLEPYEPEYLAKAFKLSDENGKYYLDLAYNRQSASPRPNLCYEYKGFFPPYPSGWKIGLERMVALDNAGDIVVKNEQLYRKIRPKKGRIRNNLWDDITEATAKERTGFPTQKPIALLARQILASSNKGDVVFDPFCGCATTPIAAERLGRSWVGCDIWDKAYEQVLVRLHREGLNPGSPEHKQSHKDLAEQHMDVANQPSFWFNEYNVNYTRDLPTRTDDGAIAAPYLASQWRSRRITPGAEDVSAKWPNAKKKAYLVTQTGGNVCWGCGRTFDHEAYLQLDHINPRAGGGANSVYNRALLCGPCNGRKGARLTLVELRNQNEKDGFMVAEIDIPAIPIIQAS